MQWLYRILTALLAKLQFLLVHSPFLLLTTLTNCNPTFDDDIPTFLGLGFLSQLQSPPLFLEYPLNLGYASAPGYPTSLISIKRCRSVRSRRKLSTSFRSRKEYLDGEIHIDSLVLKFI